jgi:hypothetical protein
MILQYAFIAGLYHESMQVFSIGALIALTAVLLIPVATAFATDHVSKEASATLLPHSKGFLDPLVLLVRAVVQCQQLQASLDPESQSVPVNHPVRV